MRRLIYFVEACCPAGCFPNRSFLGGQRVGNPLPAAANRNDAVTNPPAEKTNPAVDPLYQPRLGRQFRAFHERTFGIGAP